MIDTTKMFAIAAAMVLGGTAASPAFAADNAMKVCSTKYQAAKTAKSLPAGQTWNQFLAQCRSGLPKAAPATAAKSAPATKPAVAAAPARAPSQPGAGRAAMTARERQCGAQWKTDKAAGKTGSLTWPQYWSACDKRLKGA